MRAMVINGFGAPAVFHERVDIPSPELRPGHVLVRVVASSVNPVDYKIRSGALSAIAPEPAILGCDVAGVIEAVGEGVTGFAAGDEVFGCVGGVKGSPGTLAEYVLADAALIAPKPKTLSLEESAALPLVGITAWDGLFDKARIGEGAGRKLLVYGGTGGVGHVALQLAKHAGFTVHATASNDAKADIALSLGADAAIPYRDLSVEEIVNNHADGKGYDVVFDSVGGDNVVHCFEATKANGTVISINTRCTADLSPLHQKALSLHVVFMLIPMLSGEGRNRHGEILRELAALVDSGAVRPLLHNQRFTITQAAEAHALLERGGATGKIVLTW